MVDGPSGGSHRGLAWRSWWGVAALLLLAGGLLRLHDLGSLSVHGDEILTIRNAERAGGDAERVWQTRWAWSTTPLLQAGTKLSFAILGATPLAARLLPFVAGLLALVLLPALARSLWGGRAALVLLALLAFCPRHVEMSRLARYQSLAYLLGGVAVLFAASFVRTRRKRHAAAALVAALLAVAAHPSALLLAAVVLTAVALCWRPRGSAFLVAATAALATVAVWFSLRGVPEVVSGGFAPGPASAPAWKLAAVLLYNTGPVLCLAALVGALSELRARDAVGRLLVVAFVLPAVGLGVLAAWKTVGVRFLSSAEPGLVVLAALGIARVAGASAARAATFTVLVCATQIPLLVSNQLDGQRYDFSGLAREVRESAGTDEPVICDNHDALAFYLERPILELPPDLAGLEDLVDGLPRKDALLAVLLQRGRPVFGDDQPRLERWLERHAERVATVGRRRLDDRLYRFEIALYRLRAETLGP